MKLRNKKTGKRGWIACWDNNYVVIYPVNEKWEAYNDEKYVYHSLSEVCDDWEDYEPVEPIFGEKIRRGIRAWWDMQDNPLKGACVMLQGREKDRDGFYHWRIFGYIRNGEEKVSTDMEFRTKKLYKYDRGHEYTREELCGEEEQ